MLLGFAPLMAWEVFSILYYGFPFPNTAYAKLTGGHPAIEYWQHGVNYYRSFVNSDPAGALVVALGVLLPLYQRRLNWLPLLAGGLLYMIYIARVGGDFMQGRLFTAPLLIATIGLIDSASALSLRWKRSWITPLLVGAILVLQFHGPRPPVETTRNYGFARENQEDPWHVADERGFYYPLTGLLSSSVDGQESFAWKWKQQGLEWRASGTRVGVTRPIGLMGYYAGPSVYIIDLQGLSDPLLARLTAEKDVNWRTGHLSRKMPDGYETAVIAGADQLRDPQLAEYYSALRRIVSGPLFSTARFQTIWKMNTGQFDSLLLDARRQ
jgi:arabinofuranosyltransferase